MSPKTICLLALLVACAYPAAAGTYYVGPCKSGSYPSIMEAVLAAPAGSTIMICPGYYTDQVIISKDLTLEGMSSATASGAYIIPPGLMQTTTSPTFGFIHDPILGGPIAPVVWVTAATVNIQNIFVEAYYDNYSNPFPCPPKIVGFYYGTGGEGAINHVGFTGDSCAVGIWAENASFTSTAVTIENSYSSAGIIVAGSPNLPNGTIAVKVTGNQVYPTASDGAYGIYLYGATGTVEGNLVSGPRWGIEDSTLTPLSLTGILDHGTDQNDVTISGNTIQIDGVGQGIYVDVAGATVKANKISGPGTGIYVNCVAGGAVVSGNNITNVYQGVILPSGSAAGNTYFNVPVKFTSAC
jgi:nitrous oxidase accessory protein NosD